MTDVDMDPRAMAGVDMLRRTGAQSFQLRYSDDEEPVVWVAVAAYSAVNPLTGKQAEHYECAGALNPTAAIMRLCEQLIDGGTCQHCGRPTIFNTDSQPGDLLNAVGCVYAYDPELKTFRRDCEGDSDD
jgi:hypothetical protein